MAFHVSRYGACVLQVNFLHFRKGWMDCTDAFYAVHCLYCFVTDRT